MSIIWSNLLLLLLLLLLLCCCCCRAYPHPYPASHNEVNSREDSAEDEEIPSDLLLAALGYYKPRRSYYARSQLSGSPFLERVVHAHALGYPDPHRFDVPANYYDNEVPLLSTYELFDPETIY